MPAPIRPNLGPALAARALPKNHTGKVIRVVMHDDAWAVIEQHGLGARALGPLLEKALLAYQWAEEN